MHRFKKDLETASQLKFLKNTRGIQMILRK